MVEPYLPDKASVGFELAPLQSEGSSQQWMGTYNSNGKVAKFRIQFGPGKSAPGKPANFSLKLGEGRLIPEPGSDSSVLLVDLKKALQAKTAHQPSLEKASIPFTYANIGDDLSQAAGGGFNARPKGNWTALKLFFGEGDQEAEVFLNINAKIKKAQFSMKDPDYGDLVLDQLAKVL
jgi:hypothetical protein